MLSSSQLQTFKTDMLANANVIPAGMPFAGQTISALAASPTADKEDAIARWYNLLASPAYWVIRTDAPVADILNNIVWANFTPQPAVTGANAAQATGCSSYCQGKMLNLQTMLGFGRTSFDATKASQTSGLKDGTTQLPSGAAFANQTGGWPTIIPVLQRTCRNIEKLFAIASTVAALQNGASARGTQFDGTNGNPDIMGFEGAISASDVDAALNS